MTNVSRIFFFLSLISCAFLAGCAGAGNRSTSSASEAPSRKPVKAEHVEANLLHHIQANGEVRVGVKIDSPPFGSLLAGQPVGYDIDIINDVMSRLRVDRVTLVPVTSANRIPKLLAGEVDIVIASMTISRSRDKKVDFSIPYFQDGQGLLVAKDSDIEGAFDLTGRKVGATTGSTSLGNLKQVAPNAQIMEYENFDKLKEALVAGEIEAMTTDTTILVGLMSSLPGGRDAWRLSGNPFSTEPYGIAMPKNQSDLRAAINDALMSMWEEGDFQFLYDTWFGPGTAFNGLTTFGITPYPR